MDLINLTPAITNTDPSLPEKLSLDDFRRSLFSWFEESGLISETRSHLRMQMIKMLNATKIGLYKQELSEPVPSRTQVMSILIAEHLLKLKYFYTLSMLSNELPMNCLYEFNFLFIPETTDTEFQLQEHQVLKVLGCLQLPLKYEQQKEIYSSYRRSDNNKESLLTCLLDYISNNKFENYADNNYVKRQVKKGSGGDTNKIIRLYERHLKMINKINQYRRERIRLLSEGINDVPSVPDKGELNERCFLRHCDEKCSEQNETLNRLKGENSALIEKLKIRDKEIKELAFVLASLNSDLRSTQKKIKNSKLSRKGIILEESTEIDSNMEKLQQNVRRNLDKNEEPLIWTSVQAQLERLEKEELVIQNEYDKLKNSNLLYLLKIK